VTKAALKQEFFNESMIFTLIYHLMCFTDFVIHEKGQDFMGNSMIVFTLLLLGVNLGIMVYGIIRKQI